MCDQDPLLLEHIVTGDETLCYQFDLESKRQSMAWCSPLPATKKESLAKIQGQNTVDRLLRQKGIIHKEFVPVGQITNAAFYQAVLNLLLQRTRRVRPELHRTGKWVLLHDNAPAHSAIRVRQFLNQKIIAELDHPP